MTTPLSAEALAEFIYNMAFKTNGKLCKAQKIKEAQAILDKLFSGAQEMTMYVGDMEKQRKLSVREMTWDNSFIQSKVLVIPLPAPTPAEGKAGA